MRVTLPDERSFLTTLCPKALSYSTVWKGTSRERYLEIDTTFAKELGISKPDVEVCSATSVHTYYTHMFGSNGNKKNGFLFSVSFDLVPVITAMWECAASLVALYAVLLLHDCLMKLCEVRKLRG